MRIFTIVLLTFVLLLTSGSAFSPVAAQSTETIEIMEQIYAAIAEGDVDTALSYVADDAVLTLLPPPEGSTGVFAGKEEIRGWWEFLVTFNPRVEFSDVVITGNRATWRAKYWGDDFAAMGIAPAEFEGVHITRNGLLQSATWVFTAEFQARFEQANLLAANRALVERYMDELWTQGDLAVAEEIIAEDFVSHNFPLGDRAALIDSVVDFRAGNPNAYFTYDDMTVTADRVFIVNELMVRPEGAAADVEGEPASEPMVLILGIADGQITDRWLFMYAPAEIPPPAE